MRARAIATRFISPLESVRGYVSARSASPTVVRRSMALARVPAAVPGEEGGDHHVLQGGQCGQQPRELEDEPDLPGAQHRDLVVGEAADLHPPYPDRARGRPDEPGEHAEKGGLPAPRTSHDQDELPGPYSELHVVDGPYLRGAVSVDLRCA